MVLVGNDIASAIVHENNMILPSRSWTAEMGGEGGGGLSCAAAGEQSVKHSKRVVVGHNLLYAHGCDMKFGY